MSDSTRIIMGNISLQESSLSLVTRTVYVAVSAGTLAGSIRTVDALHSWANDMAEIFRCDFGCRQVDVLDARRAGETEAQLFQGFAGNVCLFEISAMWVRNHRHLPVEPMRM
jgi:hypothetical protein